ncbi:MAG: DnaJ C-terminal domain-containing protein [Pirellula staleyi]
MASDYYKVLGIDRTASAEEISKAYRKHARKHHPDLNPDDKNAKKRFQEVQQAYDCLNDLEKRKLYDQFGSDYEQLGGKNPFAGGHPRGTPGGGPGGQGFDFGDIFGQGAAGSVDLGDIFRQFGGGGSGPHRTRRAAPAKGQDISAEIAVPLKTIIQGGETQIQLEHDGRMESITVKIPAGIEPGKKIRLRGQGQPVAGGKSGDLLLKINVESHPFFKIAGKNLELRLPISIPEAIEGARIDVPTPSGTVTLKIPPMSNSGKKLRIKGQGLKSADGSSGDMTVELMIKLPEVAPPKFDETSQNWADAYSKPIRDGVQL